MSAPNRFTTRAVAEVPDLCMPATIMPTCEGDLCLAAALSCMNHPHVPPLRSQTRDRTFEHRKAAHTPIEARRVAAATNRSCLQSPAEDRTPDENRSCRAEWTSTQQGVADRLVNQHEHRSLPVR